MNTMKIKTSLMLIVLLGTTMVWCATVVPSQEECHVIYVTQFIPSSNASSEANGSSLTHTDTHPLVSNASSQGLVGIALRAPIDAKQLLRADLASATNFPSVCTYLILLLFSCLV